MTLELLLQYVMYAAIIVVGLLVLGLIKRATRLPSHIELKKRLNSLRGDIDALIQSERGAAVNGYDFFRMSAKCANKANKLAYTVTLMAQRERDGNLDSISALLTEVHGCITPYKFKAEEKNDISGLEQALEKTDRAILSLELILERDNDLRAKKVR